MIKKIVLLFVVLLILFPIVSASCSDVDLKVTGINMKYNFMKGEINTGETEIKEIRVYLDGESKMTDVSENFKKNILFPSFKEPLTMGQEIRLDIVLNDGTVCKNKEVLTVSEDKIMAPTSECNFNQKKEDWCIGNLVWGTHCENGKWVEFIDVDCSYWSGTCKNGKCVESGNEDNILILTDLDNKYNPSREAAKDLNTQPKENFSAKNNFESADNNSNDENFSLNPVAIVFNWLVNLFR